MELFWVYFCPSFWACCYVLDVTSKLSCHWRQVMSSTFVGKTTQFESCSSTYLNDFAAMFVSFGNIELMEQLFDTAIVQCYQSLWCKLFSAIKKWRRNQTHEINNI